MLSLDIEKLIKYRFVECITKRRDTSLQQHDDDDIMFTEISLAFVWDVIFIDESSVYIRSLGRSAREIAPDDDTRAREKGQGRGKTLTAMT